MSEYFLAEVLGDLAVFREKYQHLDLLKPVLEAIGRFECMVANVPMAARRRSPTISLADREKRGKARIALGTAVKRGRIPPAKAVPCTDCGEIYRGNGPAPEYDHYLGYDPEHALDVQAVCRRCHVGREAARGIPPFAIQAAALALITEVGVTAASRRIGVSTETMYRAKRGQRVRPGTLALLREKFGAAAEAAS